MRITALFELALVFTAIGVYALLWSFVNMARAFYGPLLPHTPGADILAKPPTFYQRVFVFNLTNYEAFLAGNKPVVEEIGPYVFSWRTRKNLDWSKDDVLSYSTSRMIYFEPSLSSGSLWDRFTTVNFAVSACRVASADADSGITCWNTSRRSLIFNITIGEYFVHGFQEDNIVESAPGLLPLVDKRPALFAQINATTGPQFNVSTGQQSHSGVNNIMDFNGDRNLDYYMNSQCSVSGTNGQIFPSFYATPAQVTVFFPFLCKPWTLRSYKHFILQGDEEIVRFIADKATFLRESTSDKCVNWKPTGISGLFDASNCHLDNKVGNEFVNYFAPVLSWPHFLHADVKLHDDVHGLRPESRKHEFFIDVHSRSGVTVDMRLRYQVNVRLYPSRIMEATIPKIMFPIYWQEIAHSRPGRDALLTRIKGNWSSPFRYAVVALVFLFLGAVYTYLILRQIPRAEKRPPKEKEPAAAPDISSSLDSDTAREVSEEPSTTSPKKSILRSPRGDNDFWTGTYTR